jgi:hypothetical protein
MMGSRDGLWKFVAAAIRHRQGDRARPRYRTAVVWLLVLAALFLVLEVVLSR